MPKTPVSELDRLRARIADLKHSLDRLRAAPRAHAETRADVLAWVRGAAAHADAYIANQVTSSAFGGAPADALKVRAQPDGFVDLAPLLAALIGPERLADALCRHLETVEDGPPASERVARAAELEAALFDAELAEEQLIEAAEQRGEHVRRRPDADPRAVLWMSTPEPTPEQEGAA